MAQIIEIQTHQGIRCIQLEAASFDSTVFSSGSEDGIGLKLSWVGFGIGFVKLVKFDEGCRALGDGDIEGLVGARFHGGLTGFIGAGFEWCGTGTPGREGVGAYRLVR